MARRRGTTPIIGAEGLALAIAGKPAPAADLPVENSQLREALIAHERLCMVDLRAAFASDDPAREIAPIMKRIFESRSRMFAHLQQREVGLQDRIMQDTRDLEAMSAEISRLRSERSEIAQEFGVSTDFDLGEHARVVMASQDDFKAELARLRADQITKEEVKHINDIAYNLDNVDECSMCAAISAKFWRISEGRVAE